MIDPHSTFLLLSAAAAVITLILLVAWARLNPFLALMLASLGLGVVAGMPALGVLKSFEAGLGTTLGHIAIVVALGTMLGKMMAESGGAEQIALTLMRIFGERRLPWAMMFAGLIVGLPAFFEVGFVLLIPIAYTAARRANRSMIAVGLPMLAGLSVAHALVPPHPAALMAVSIYHADVGRTILYALIIGIPTAAIAGPLYAIWLDRRMPVEGTPALSAQLTDRDPTHRPPSFGTTIATILLPVALMLVGSLAPAALRGFPRAAATATFVGNDDVALFIGVLVSFVTLGQMRGFNREAILRFSTESLAPTAAITLLVGAGGGFGRVLMDSGVAKSLVLVATSMHVPTLVFAWTLAALLRLATGSSTAAMTTAAAMVAPIALHGPHVNPALLAIATGAGSVFFSHVNDGGFWLVKEYFGMSVPETIKSWSVCETLIAVCGLLFSLALSYVV